VPKARAAFGLRAHSGWATLVTVTAAPAIVDRRRIELAAPGVPGSSQPYHAAEGLELKKAETIVGRCAEGARRLAAQAFQDALRDVEKEGFEVVGCGLLLASGRPLPELAAILASHALIHTADGELYREALVHAARRHGLPVTKIREKDVLDQGATALRLTASEIQRRVQEIGKPLGPPWRQDEKLATLAGWLSLAAGRRA
jgi:hypothetical protein